MELIKIKAMKTFDKKSLKFSEKFEKFEKFEKS